MTVFKALKGSLFLLIFTCVQNITGQNIISGKVFDAKSKEPLPFVNVILKGTRVDGIYTADPEKDKTATKYDTITFSEVFKKGLEVMDMTAFTLCNENKLPIIVFDMNTTGNLKKLITGETIGTLVTF